MVNVIKLNIMDNIIYYILIRGLDRLGKATRHSLLREMSKMVDVLAECLPEGETLGIVDSVLLAGVADVVTDLVQVAVVHRGEQVVLDLHVQPACQQEHKVVVGGDVVRGDDLVFEEVLVELVRVVRGQVIDLAGYHEAHREEVDGQNGEQEASQGKSV